MEVSEEKSCPLPGNNNNNNNQVENLIRLKIGLGRERK